MFIFGGHDIREGSLDTLWMVELTRIQDGEINQKPNEFSDGSEKKI